MHAAELFSISEPIWLHVLEEVGTVLRSQVVCVTCRSLHEFLFAVRYDSKSSISSAFNFPIRLLSSVRIASARARLPACNARIFSSTVSRATRRYANTGRL